MRKKLTLAIGLSLAVLAAACGGHGDNGSSTLGPVPTSEPTGATSPTSVTGGTTTPIIGSGSDVPTTSPGTTGSVTQGNASLAVAGALQTNQSLMALASPAVYAIAPGAFALNWQSAAAGFALAGPTFVGTRATADTMRLSFFVHASSGTYRFTSTDGSCSVTVAQADVATFSGTFACDSITDDGGTVTVSAQGAFLAAG